MVLGGKKARVVGREACGAGRAALGYNCIIDNVTHAPQARDGISWRDAADWIVCRMPIRYLLRSREIRSRETRRKANEEREKMMILFSFLFSFNKKIPHTRVCRTFQSRSHTVDISWEHGAFLHIRDAEEAGGDALEADGKAAVRGHAVAEGVEVETESIRIHATTEHLLAVVGCSVLRSAVSLPSALCPSRAPQARISPAPHGAHRTP